MPRFDVGPPSRARSGIALFDTQGLLLHGIVTAGRFRIATAVVALLATLFGLTFPYLGKLFADAPIRSKRSFTAPWPAILAETDLDRDRQAIRSGEGPSSSSPGVGWSNRTIAWLNRCRRLAKDWENLNRNALAFMFASIQTHVVRKPVILHKVSGRTLRPTVPLKPS